MNSRCFILAFLVGSYVTAINATSIPDPELEDLNETDTTFLSPEDFVNGELVKATDIGESDVDPIAESGKFEGDIDLLGLPYEAYVDKVIDDSPFKTEKEVNANAIRNKWFHWPNAEIPYEIAASHFSRQGRGIIASAIADYSKYTCIRWVPRRRHHRSYVRFIAGKGCYSTIGRAGGAQTLSLGRGCVTKGITIHEMMHAAGFFHEQARADRNGYVTIEWNNIQPWARGNFKRMTLKAIDHLGTNYDYSSIMHYGKNYFSRNGKNTIVVKKSGVRVGQRGGFSDTDIEKLNKLYKCLNTRKPITTPRPIAGVKICADKNEHCAGWASGGYCSHNAYTKENCKRSCGLCGTKSNCYDRRRSCQYWKRKGHCNSIYSHFMTRYCAKTCGKC